MIRPGPAIALLVLLAACAARAADDAPAPAPAPVRVAVTVPSGGWDLKIAEVHEVDDEIWVLTELHNRGGLAAQVITRLEATAPVVPPADRKVRTFVSGATWNWRDPDAGPVEFVDDLDAVRKKAKAAGGRLLHKAPEEPQARGVYIVMFRKDLFKDGVTADGKTLEKLARERVATVDGEVKAVLGIIHGVSAVLTPQAAERLRQLPEVAAVEQDGPVRRPQPVRPR